MDTDEGEGGDGWSSNDERPGLDQLAFTKTCGYLPTREDLGSFLDDLRAMEARRAEQTPEATAPNQGNVSPNVDAVDRDGRTALMIAAQNGHTDTVTALAGTHGANVDAVDRNGWTALMFAARNGHTATVNALVGTHGANVDAATISGRTALMLAAERGHTDIVNALAGSHGANVDAVDCFDRTALMCAAQEGHTGTVNALRARARERS